MREPWLGLWIGEDRSRHMESCPGQREAALRCHGLLDSNGGGGWGGGGMGKWERTA